MTRVSLQTGAYSRFTFKTNCDLQYCYENVYLRIVFYDMVIHLRIPWVEKDLNRKKNYQLLSGMKICVCLRDGSGGSARGGEGGRRFSGWGSTSLPSRTMYHTRSGTSSISSSSPNYGTWYEIYRLIDRLF